MRSQPNLGERVYLSIDIDYWKDEGVSDGAIKFLERVLPLSKKTNIVMYHDQMLPYVNRSEANTLYNYDFHSDLTDFRAEERSAQQHFNEGTWINYVNFRDRGHFKWIYPYNVCWESSGRCDDGPEDGHSGPFYNSEQTCGWAKTSRSKGITYSHLEACTMEGIGICFSPNWICKPLGMEVAEFLNEKGIMSKTKIKELERCFKAPWNRPYERVRYDAQKYTIVRCRS